MYTTTFYLGDIINEPNYFQSLKENRLVNKKGFLYRSLLATQFPKGAVINGVCL